ncbi:MAG: recombinase family protein [Janthinobacterium lividum]
MASGAFVAYYRVSTAKQGASGLGLEAQRQAVAQHLNGGEWKLLAEFVEVESGKRSDRAQLAAALDRCKLTGATLLVAKMDRLSRNLHFLTGLQNAGVKFVAVDNPQANNLTVHILAAVAQAEGEAISARTKAALAASTKTLGGWRGGPVVNSAAGIAAKQAKADAFAACVLPTINAMRGQGISLERIAGELTAQGVLTAQGKGSAWTATAVRRVLARA